MTAWGVTDLEVRYGEHIAVTGLNLELMPGSIVALVGGDGAGKTSVLKTLAGLIQPSAGRVAHPGRRGVGFVAASGSGVYGDLTVVENLEFAGRAYKLGGPEMDARQEELLRRTGLASARSRLAAQLSGGMRQKLALAVALLHEPDLLILDEPTTGVDPVSRAELWRLIAQAAADGAAVVLATSYVDEAERAGHVVVMDSGRQVAAGSPEDILAATPGTVFEMDERPSTAPAWRRGRVWRAWSASGALIPGSRACAVDLEDAVVVAELARPGRPAEVA